MLASGGGLNNNDVQLLTVTVVNINDAPEITAPNGGAENMIVYMAENTTAVTDIDAFDADGQTLTYWLAGIFDDFHFQIDASTGALSFIAVPDYETEMPLGVLGGTLYLVNVRVSDGIATATQSCRGQCDRRQRGAGDHVRWRRRYRGHQHGRERHRGDRYRCDR